MLREKREGQSMLSEIMESQRVLQEKRQGRTMLLEKRQADGFGRQNGKDVIAKEEKVKGCCRTKERANDVTKEKESQKII